MTHGITNTMRREAERAMARHAAMRIGIVSSYDKGNYAVKVRIQPEDVETGWLPIGSTWTGNGWGDFCAPSIGDIVEVHHQEGGKQAGIVGLRQFGDQFRPLPVPSGERWIVHKSGAAFKLKNDGTASMTDGHGASITMNGDGTASITANQITSTAARWNHNGQFNATSFYAEGLSTIPDGTYCTGLGLSTNGYITISGGLITAIVQAT